MLIRYTIADPTGNITALVESPVAPELRRTVASAIMAAEPEVEQLGFLAPAQNGADIALTMAGGEFCGNACLSAAAWHVQRRGLDGGTVPVSMSGAENPVSTELNKITEAEYLGSVEMPLPTAAETLSTALGELCLIRFPGISHLILPADVSHAEAEAMIRPLCSSLGTDALGLMLFDESRCTLEPLVFVPGADSLFWEHSCASGTCAVGAFLALREKQSVRIELKQPGGSLSVCARFENESIQTLSLGGDIRLHSPKCLEI